MRQIFMIFTGSFREISNVYLTDCDVISQQYRFGLFV